MYCGWIFGLLNNISLPSVNYLRLISRFFHALYISSVNPNYPPTKKGTYVLRESPLDTRHVLYLLGLSSVPDYRHDYIFNSVIMFQKQKGILNTSHYAECFIFLCLCQINLMRFHHYHYTHFPKVDCDKWSENRFLWRLTVGKCPVPIYLTLIRDP